MTAMGGGHHHHHHHHVSPEDGDRKVLAAIAINLGLTVAQVIGGALAGSLALIADALHNLSDAVSLIIAWLARRIARRPATADMSFGYGRAEVVAALINYTTLIVIGLYLAWEAALRFLDPQEVDGWLVVAIAGLALVVDLATALLTWRMSRTSVNIRAAFLHNLADALGSVAVIVAGAAILIWDWRLADPIATLLIAGYILWMSFREIGGVIRILMLGSPPGLSAGEVVAGIESESGVSGVHHAHLWQMGEHEPALDAHVVIEPGRWSEADAIKGAIKRLLRDRFAIGHSTIEMECAAHACDEPQTFGHDGRS